MLGKVRVWHLWKVRKRGATANLKWEERGDHQRFLVVNMTARGQDGLTKTLGVVILANVYQCLTQEGNGDLEVAFTDTRQNRGVSIFKSHNDRTSDSYSYDQGTMYGCFLGSKLEPTIHKITGSVAYFYYQTSLQFVDKVEWMHFSLIALKYPRF